MNKKEELQHGVFPSVTISKKDIEAQLYSICCNALLFVASGDGYGDHIVHWYECTKCRRPSSPKECILSSNTEEE